LVQFLLRAVKLYIQIHAHESSPSWCCIISVQQSDVNPNVNQRKL